MGRRFSATLGFAIGIGSASLFNLDFYSVMAQRAIASLGLTNPSTNLAQPFFDDEGCATNLSQAADLRNADPQNISLLKHVPPLPRRLNWYGITQENAIANAPKPVAPKPAITQWQTIQAELFNPTGPCGASSPNLAQRHSSPLQQQAHFIISLASLNQKNDWLLQPQPQPHQPIHSVWRDQEPIVEIRLASQVQ